MAKILHIRSVNDYARYVGAPVLHELVSVIHYDELTAMRHSLNSYEVYAMFLNDGELPELTYGTVQYNMPQHTLMCVAPGQIGGRTDTGEIVEQTDIAALLQQMPSCHNICCTGGKAAQTLADTLHCAIPKVGEYIETDFAGRTIRFWRMPSSSRAYPLSLDNKAASYRRMFEAIGLL